MTDPLRPDAGGTPLAPRESVVAAVRRILRPVIRLLVSQGITYPFLTDILKEVYVETASREFALGGKRPTDSRLTLLTGVHRKDIRRLLREPRPAEATPPGLTLGTQIVARWLGERAYCDAKGRPLALPRTPRAGGERSFAALVESISKNVRPRSVLDELVRLGVAEIDEKDQVHLVTRGFVPGREVDAKAYYLGEALHDHLSAGVHNLRTTGKAFLERSVYYDELSAAAIDKLAARAEVLAMAALQTLNVDGMALERDDPPARGARMRMRMGVYFYAEPVQEQESPDDGVGAPSPRTGQQSKNRS